MLPHPPSFCTFSVYLPLHLATSLPEPGLRQWLHKWSCFIQRDASPRQERRPGSNAKWRITILATASWGGSFGGCTHLSTRSPSDRLFRTCCLRAVRERERGELCCPGLQPRSFSLISQICFHGEWAHSGFQVVTSTFITGEARPPPTAYCFIKSWSE